MDRMTSLSKIYPKAQIPKQKKKPYALQVDVASWRSAKGVEPVLDGASLANRTHAVQVVDGGIAARGAVLQGHGSGDLLGLLGVQKLVNPVEPVEHGVVEKEGRVVGAGVEISVVTVDGVCGLC